LYLTPYGRSVLYRNQGNGQFSVVSEKAGVGAPGWFSSFGASLNGLFSPLITPLSEFQERPANMACGGSQSCET
jgi:hypothetical protein